jgi:hypothetical protein
MLAGAGFAQTTGSIVGSVTGPDGAAVATAAVHAKNLATGTVYKATTSARGDYVLARLPGGNYELLVPTVGFTYSKFERKNVTVQVGQNLRIDVRLEWGPNLGTPGDDPSIAMRTKYGSVSGKTPRTREGKPDFTGMWNGSDDPDPEPPSMLPWADALFKERIANDFRDTPSGFCLPGNTFPTGPLLYQIVQTPKLIVQIFEDIASPRLIFVDGRGHPKDPNPTWVGHSIGKWEGDTLVIDTVGMNDKSWLVSGEPHTEKLHIVERYRRPSLGLLQIDATVEDSAAFTKPYQIHMVWNLAPGEELTEYICTDNNRDLEHLRAK